MKSFLITLLLCLGWVQAGLSATLLAHYSGGVNPSLSSLPAESKWTTSTTMTYVQTGSYMDGEIPVWRVYDPGTASTNTPGNPWANVTYNKSINAATTQSILAQGWTLSGVLKINEDVSPGVSYDASSNIWLGYIHAIPDQSPDRWLYAFTFGKTADGKTRVGLHGGGMSLILDPGYHEYTMTYDPVAKKANVYVDGIFRTQYGGGEIKNGGANGDSMVYWGDNGSQTTAQVERAAYYQSINFYLIPEPSKALLGMLSLLWIALIRRRELSSSTYRALE